MRPLSLTLRGLHSYRDEQTVDFEKLGERGLFGIFGPTGAGKSTLLDAITLALYGTVERASKCQGILHTDATEVAVKLRFEAGPDRRVYVVERILKMRKAGLETRLARIHQERDGAQVTLADQTRETNRAVREVVGLEEDDFKRVVVLPQGKFAAFLHLGGAERRQMLEGILGLERYGRKLQDAIGRRLGGVKTELSRLEGGIELVRGATAAAVEQARAELQRQQRLAEDAAQALVAAAAKLDGAREVREAMAAVRDREARQKVLVGRRLEMEQRQAEHEDALRAEPLRDLLEGRERQEEEVAAARARKEKADGDERQWRQDLEQARAAEASAAAALAERGPGLEARRDELMRALALEPEVKSLADERKAAGREQAAATAQREQRRGQRESLARQVADADRDLEALRAAVARERVEPAWRAQVDAAAEALRAFQDADAQLARQRKRSQERAREAEEAQRRASGEAARLAKAQVAAEAARAALAQHEEARPADPHALVEAQKAAALADQKVDRIEAAERELAEHRERLASSQRNAEDLGRRVEQAGAAAAEAEARAAAAAERSQSLERRHLAAQLVAVLRDGEPCPVCGAKEHPAPASDAEAPAMAAASAEAQETAARAAKAREAHRSAEARREEAEHRRAEDGARVATREEELAARRAELPPAWRERPLAALREGRAAEHAELARSAEQRKAWDVRAAALESDRRNSEAALGEAAASARAADSAAEERRRAAADAARELDEAGREVGRRGEALDAARGPLAREAIGREREAIQARDREAQRLESEARRAEKAHRDAQAALGATEAALAALDEALRGLEQRLKDLDARHGARLAELRAITEGAKAQRLLDDCEDESARLERAVQDTRAQAELRLRRHTDAQVALAAARAGLEHAEADLRELAARLRTELAARRFPSAQAAEAALRSAAAREALAEAWRAYEREVIATDADLKNARERLGGRSVSEAELGELRRKHALADEGARDALAMAGQQQERARKLAADHEKLREREAELARLTPLRDRLQTLEKLVQGKKLVEFMAEQEIAAIARDASVRLRALTHDRYELLPQKENPRSAGGFLVRDHHNGGEDRPVSSLSGGETFLASLAMALALSTQIQLRGRQPIRFFFLDEGFGSLDPATLEVALGALERLQRENLTVGVITHVDEVRTRLPRRLIVAPAAQGQGSRVSIEEA